VRAVIGTMSSRAADAALVEVALRVLGHPRCVDAVVLHGGIRVVLAAMTSAHSASLLLMVPAVQIMAHIAATSTEYASLVATEDGAAQISTIMQKYASDAEIRVSGGCVGMALASLRRFNCICSICVALWPYCVAILGCAWGSAISAF
jgi:hypothetical protein